MYVLPFGLQASITTTTFFRPPTHIQRCPSQTGPPSKDRWLYRVIKDRPIRAIHKDRQIRNPNATSCHPMDRHFAPRWRQHGILQDSQPVTIACLVSCCNSCGISCTFHFSNPCTLHISFLVLLRVCHSCIQCQSQRSVKNSLSYLLD